MHFRLLGPLEVHDGDAEVRLVRRQERLLLALLLLRANELTSPEQLIDLVWPDDPPDDARGALQVYVSRLRKAGITIDGGRDGYAVRVPSGCTDLDRFRTAVAGARALPDPADRGSRLRAALELWRGELLPELVDQATRDRLCASVEEERRSAFDERIQADLAAGLHEQLLDELPAVVEQDPTREATVAAWMTALHRAGRRTEALDGYQRLSLRLRDEHGLDPVPSLRRLHLAILRNDHRLLRATSVETSDVPRELPTDVSLLVGREELLTAGRTVLRSERAVLALWGGAGVGKSAVATRLAHQVTRDYPDGQLFARMQHVDGSPVEPAVVLGRMLRSLGLTADEIPETTEARSELFRERTAGLALLLLLDDVLEPGQVRPLLPAGPRCAVILTSRKPLPLGEIASSREVTRLNEEEGRDLLVQLIGRQTGDPESLAVILDHCVGLPLALRVVGSRLALSDSATAADFAAALSDDDRRLDWLVAGDRAVRISMELTLSAADPTAKALFDRIVLVGVDELSPWVATALLGGEEQAATEALDRLLDLGLFEVVAWTPFRRLRMHSIVRSYAAECFGQLSPEGAGQASSRFLRTVLRQTSLADAGVPDGGTVATRLAVPDSEEIPLLEKAIESDPMAWLDLEWPLICVAVTTAIAQGQLEIAARLALRVDGYLKIRDHREAWIAMLTETREALAESEHLELLARVDHDLFGAVNHGGRTDEAESLAARGLISARACKVPEMLGRALYQVAYASKGSGDFKRTMAYAQEAYELIMDDPALTGLTRDALAIIGMAAADLEDNAAAAAAYEKSAALQPAGTRSLAVTLEAWAGQLLKLGELDKAEEVLGRSYAINAATANELGMAETDCASAYLAILRGEFARARQLLDGAREVFERRGSVMGRYLTFAWEAQLAMAQGQVAEGRRIRLEAIAQAEAEGQHYYAIKIRETLESDPRDPVNAAG